MTAGDVLDVWLDNRRAGRLSRVGAGLAFSYDDEYRHRADATLLSLSIPLADRDHDDAQVTAFFEALLPEQGPARERLELESGVSRTNTFGLLEYVGRDLPGAVCVYAAGSDVPHHGGVVELSAGDLAERIADLRQSAATGASSLIEHGRWSLAGAQAKVALMYDEGRWGIPFGSTPTTHIVKPAIPGYEQLDAYEVVCLRTARRLGLSAAHAWLQPLVDGTHAAVIARFDRVITPDGVQRVHQEDLCQALGRPAWQKYERDGGPSISSIATLFDRLPPQFRADSRLRFLDAMIFNYLLAGTDGHARNFALLLSGPDATLAPLYDLNSALPYTRPWGRRFDSVRKLHSSFVVGRTDAFTRVTADDWVTVATLLGVDHEYVVPRLEAMSANLPAAIAATVDEVSGEAGIVLDFDWMAALTGYRAECALA